ncbi:hypothetical protein [Halalkalibacillus halophilus]|uniref:hypothetical protein n=1 Tax=Halalkalibacillus halophilus TaxID=392827 RepID=UPI0003FC4B65|nr:hypothetical protein [Halalkalibacillus halophilus]
MLVVNQIVIFAALLGLAALVIYVLIDVIKQKKHVYSYFLIAIIAIILFLIVRILIEL